MWECKKTTDQIASIKGKSHALSINDYDKVEMKQDIFESISIEDCTGTYQIIFEELDSTDNRYQWESVMADHGFDGDDEYQEFYEKSINMRIPPEKNKSIEKWLNALSFFDEDLKELIMDSMDGYLQTLLEELWDETPACPYEDRI